ncbi:MAG TPA: F0F1 ATP synthase subunit A [Alphaproteobacteria bacterium]|nr:F0F1 ATP synthase subunit A [Alphaproteobacteria bacterium]
MAEAGAHSPLEQFKIEPIVPLHLGRFDLSFTNSSLVMVLALVLITGFLLLGVRARALVPGRLQSMAEMSYEFVATLLSDTVGEEGKRYFPIVFAIFMFVLFGNLIGLVPYSFTFTSHIIVTFALAFCVFLGVTILAIARHGLHFARFFVPPGVSVALWPLLIPIEIISYLSRPISLSVRLFANMLAGHTLLNVFAGFVFALGFAGLVPLAFVVALSGLEFLIAFLQAYVFAILTCLYINDALHLH